MFLKSIVVAVEKSMGTSFVSPRELDLLLKEKRNGRGIVKIKGKKERWGEREREREREEERDSSFIQLH
jgi:hypothetical protein